MLRSVQPQRFEACAEPVGHLQQVVNGELDFDGLSVLQLPRLAKDGAVQA
jgi:hypothetical protein